MLEAFLPKAMPAEELHTLVEAAITETGATTPADMGKVMRSSCQKLRAARPMTLLARPCGNCSKNKMGISNARNRPYPARIRTLQVILLILVSIISYGALVLPQAFRPAASQIQVGEVSPAITRLRILLATPVKCGPGSSGMSRKCGPACLRITGSRRGPPPDRAITRFVAIYHPRPLGSECLPAAKEG